MDIPEIIDPVFAKTSRKRSFSMTTSVLGLFSRKRGSINSGTGDVCLVGCLSLIWSLGHEIEFKNSNISKE